MIFTTQECLTAEQQEELELRQLAARGYIGPDAPRGRRKSPLPSKVVDRMEPGVEYRVTDLMKLGKVDYDFVARLADKGIIKRTGERHSYRYSKVAA